MIHQQLPYSEPESSFVDAQTTITHNSASFAAGTALYEVRMNLQLPTPHTLRKSVLTGSTATTMQSRKRSRRVQFSEARVVGTVVNRLDLSQEQSNKIWYPSSELDQFKADARILCRLLREQHQQSKESCSQGTVIVPRGLEQRVCGQRQRHRHLAIRCVLKAQQKCRCSDFIGIVARKCTQWATGIAHLEGQHDFCDVYNPVLKALLPKVKDVPMNELPIQTKRKVPSNNNIDDSDNDSVEVAQRNVRARKA
jgi:hypothetical protein